MIARSLIGIIYQTGAINGPGKWVVIVSLYLFLLVFCATWAMCVRCVVFTILGLTDSKG